MNNNVWCMFLKGFSYINTNDMHDDNFGIRITENPTPNDIVILDFDISI